MSEAGQGKGSEPRVPPALVDAAKAARRRAYAPYSRYHVGAAVMTRSGRIFAGCNVENCSFGATICAERSAVCQMVAGGECDPLVCIVVTGGATPAPPCGLCRQVLAEFARDMRIVLVAERPEGDAVRETSLAALLPDAFRL